MAAVPRVLVVAEHASLRFGGEASLPWHYFSRLRERGAEAWLLVHARTREELLRLARPEDRGRLRFVEDTRLDRALWAAERRLPQKVGEQTLGVARHMADQLRQREIARRMIVEHGIELVHEAAPISPRRPSAMFDLGAPVVIGPMCGGMEFPPAFRHLEGTLTRVVERAGRRLSNGMNMLLPGKLQADALVVANHLTRAALPGNPRGRIHHVIESGVDMRVWTAPPTERRPDEQVRFVFLGRFVAWKGVDLLLDAFAAVARAEPAARLDLIGDGVERAALERQARWLGVASRVRFTGWLTREVSAERLRASDVLVMPSLRECGGTAVLEAMACGLPSVVTDWGGLSYYVDDASGIRVPPVSRDGLVAGLAHSMLHLAHSPAVRRAMGEAARERVKTAYLDWDAKVDRMLEVYRETLDGAPTDHHLRESADTEALSRQVA